MHTIIASFGEGVASLSYNVPAACMCIGMGMGGELIDSKVERLTSIGIKLSLLYIYTWWV